MNYTTEYWLDYFGKNDITIDKSSFALFCLPYMKQNDSLLDICCGNGRDSMFFHNNGISTYAFDLSPRNDTEFNFKELNLENKEHNFLFNDLFFNSVYCRFVLHSVPEILEDYILINSNRVLKEDGFLFIEVRSDKGFISKEIDNHYRRLLNIDVLEEKLINLNFEIIFKQESDNLSIYKNDNPTLIRIIAKKKGQIKIQDEKSFADYKKTTGCVDANLSKYLLLKIKHILDNHNIVFLLLFGTLLGAYREKKFIEYDTDIDLGFFFNNAEDIRTLINEGYFAVYGIKFIRDLGSPSILFSLTYKNDYIDFYFFTKEIKSLSYKCDVYYSISDIQIESKLTQIEFLGCSFLTVNNIEDYLTKVYGNWKTPLENYHADQ